MRIRVLWTVLTLGIAVCVIGSAGLAAQAASSLDVMEDGTIFDADWYSSQLEAAGITGIGSTQTELYRHYQLYGQALGLSAYDESAWSDKAIAEAEEEAAQIRAQLEEEYGTGWITILAGVCDTDYVAYWNTDYEVSAKLAQALSDAIAAFEAKGYDVGFVLVDLTTGGAVSYRAGVEVYSASVIKAPYIFSLLEAGYEPTNDMYQAGHNSDNDAYVRLSTAYGRTVFAQWLEGTNIPSAQAKTRYITTTPLDLCRMFYKGLNLLLGEEESSDWARDTFTDSLNSAIAQSVGEEKTVYSKAGWIAAYGSYHTNSYTNAAIVDGEYPYVVAIMSNSPGSIGLQYAQDLALALDDIQEDMAETYMNGVGAVLENEEVLQSLKDFANQAAAAVKD